MIAGPGPIDMLAPPINKLTLLKTAAFVLNYFELCAFKSTALAPDLRDNIGNRSAKHIVKLLSISYK